MRKAIAALALVLAVSGCNRQASSTSSTAPDSAPPRGTPAIFAPRSGSEIPASDVSVLEQINRENIRVIDSALPSLVRISAMVSIDSHGDISGNAIHVPFEFERRPRNSAQLNEIAYGSGVVIKKEGYIVTNSHVVDGAHDVEVQLEDHRVFPATVIASDARVDVAILKIAANDLKPLSWGDSDKVRVGEQVFAIGNPFDLGDSASRGIISATGRNIPEPSASYQDFLQTDAAINPGNSGGALINIHGELIGINVEIASTTGADRGVGFALPSNLLRYDISKLLDGDHAHGYLGVKLPLSVDEGVIAQLGLGTGEGALLAGIYPHSPAEKAKLQLADFITEIDGHKVESIFELQVIAAQIPVGKEAEVKYIRNGERRSTFVKVAASPDFLQGNAMPILEENPATAASVLAAAGSENALSGLQVTDLDNRMRKRFQIDDWISSGVVVTGVQASSVAESRGFEQGDVIEMVCVRRASPEKLFNVRELTSVAAALKPDQGIALLVHRGPANRFIYLSPLK